MSWTEILDRELINEAELSMSGNLDKLIRDARNDVPDSGEYRRLNRALLKERMAHTAPRRRRNHRLLLGTLSLVFLVLFSGQLNQLGSDGFDMVFEDWDHPLGKTVPVVVNEFRGSSFTRPKGFSDDDLDEVNRALAANEGELLWVQGTSYGGKTNWIKYIGLDINGKVHKTGDSLFDRPDIELDNYYEFLIAHDSEMVAFTSTNPPDRQTVMTFDGVPCNVQIWVTRFPAFGEVTRYFGTPIEDNKK